MHYLALAVTLCIAMAVPAQAPSPWSALQLPNGAAVGSTSSIGKLVTFRESGLLHVWSATTRRWSQTPISATAQLRVTNDCALVMDGAVWTAFAAATGRFETLTVSPNAVLHNVATNNNDSVLLVGDGNALHAFSGFVGNWVMHAAAPNAQVAVVRHVGIFAQAGLVAAFDAFTGQWSDQPVPGAMTQVSADGTAAWADDGATVFAYSAAHRAWLSASLPSGASVVRGDDWTVWYSSAAMLGYSSIRHRFDAMAVGATGVAANQDIYALMHTVIGVVSFTATSGVFGGPFGAPGAVVQSGAAAALLTDPNGITAYSALLDTATPLARSLGSVGCAGSVAFVMDATTGLPVLYSAATGAWADAPAGTATADPLLTTTVAAMATATGVVTFNARTGHFVPLVRSGVTFTGNASSAPLVAYDASDWLAFDARNETWVATPRSGNGPIAVQIWRTAVLAFDGNDVLGFGVQAGSWSRQTLPEPLVASRTNSESGRINTATWLFAHSALGEVSPLAQFPEFRRLQPYGAPLHLSLAIPANGLSVLGLGGLAAAPLTVPGLGDLWLTGPLATVGVAGAAGGEPVALALPLPGSPALRGVVFAFQAAMLPVAGGAWLTDAATVTCF